MKIRPNILIPAKFYNMVVDYTYCDERILWRWIDLKKRCCCSSSILFILLFTMFTMGLIFNVYDKYESNTFEMVVEFIDSKASLQFYGIENDGGGDEPLKELQNSYSQTDPILIGYIKKRIEFPPTSGSDPLAGHYQKTNKFSPQVIVMSFMYKYLQEELKAGGNYVEIGMGKGMSESHSLRLDMIYHWKGMIVENNPDGYTLIRRVKRHAMTANFCISPRSYSMFRSENQTSPLYEGRIIFRDKVECYPLLSVLSAVSKRKKRPIEIDFMSLTTGGTEFDILKTLADQVIFKMLYIDHRKIHRGFEDIHDYMEKQGYTWVHGVKENSVIVGSIFVHNFVFSRSF